MRINSKVLIFLFLGLINFINTNYVYAVEQKYQHFIERFKTDVKNRDAQSMSAYIAFPLSREYPVPDIKSAAELKQRFDDLFDKELTALIVNSDVEKDWTAADWRGFGLDAGTVWIDYNGRLMAINHQSKTEQDYANRLIEADKATLHESLKKFAKPVLKWEMKKFKVRVDDLGNGHFRYASWRKSKKYSDKPDLVLFKGAVRSNGSGGNHYYIFKNGQQYSYKVYVNIIGADDTPPGELRVYKWSDQILHDELPISSK